MAFPQTKLLLGERVFERVSHSITLVPAKMLRCLWMKFKGQSLKKMINTKLDGLWVENQGTKHAQNFEWDNRVWVRKSENTLDNIYSMGGKIFFYRTNFYSYPASDPSNPWGRTP